MVSRACLWTARIVGSTRPEEASRSEQWKPSLNAMGCWSVLRLVTNSDDTVASRHGSSEFINNCNLLGEDNSRRPFAKNNLSTETFQPAYAAFVASTLGVVGALNVSGNQYVHWRCVVINSLSDFFLSEHVPHHTMIE